MKVRNEEVVQFVFEGLEQAFINIRVKHTYEDSVPFTEAWLNGSRVCTQALLELLKHSHLVQEALQVKEHPVVSDDLDQ